MTHTLHRRGTPDSLSEDYVVLCMASQGINNVGCETKLQEFLRIAMNYNPKNIGEMTLGNMFSHEVKEVIANAKGIAHAVFDDPDTVINFLRDLKEADLGMSVVVSGIIDNADECCNKAGLNRHTVEFSLGIWGRTERLPSEDVLGITTMCGHGMIPNNLVKSQVQEIREGNKSADDAAEELASHCCCGIFNPVRGGKLLAAMAKLKEGS